LPAAVEMIWLSQVFAKRKSEQRILVGLFKNLQVGYLFSKDEARRDLPQV
jgi:hypothetical protein